MGSSEYLYIAVGMFGRGAVGIMLALLFGFMGYVTWFGLRFLFAEYWVWVGAEWHFRLWIGGGAAMGGYLAWLVIRRDLAVLLLKAPEVVSGLLSKAWTKAPASVTLFKPLSQDWVGRSIRVVTGGFWATVLISCTLLIAVGYLGAWGGFEYQEGRVISGTYSARITTPAISSSIFGGAFCANAVMIIIGFAHQIRNQGR